jgi:hypothetical protein
VTNPLVGDNPEKFGLRPHKSYKIESNIRKNASTCKHSPKDGLA